MKTYVAITLILLASAHTSVAHALESYLWNKRLVLIFSPSTTDPRLLEAQKSLEESQHMLAIRDVEKMLVVTGHSFVQNADDSTDIHVSELQQKFQIHPDEFSIFLIGKDGGVKLRQELLNVHTLIQAIDAMPMGAAEKTIRKSEH